MTFAVVVALARIAIPSEQATQVRASAQPPALEIPMELMAGRPLIRTTINGQGPFPLLLVPEIQRTLIDRKLIDLLKLKPLRDAKSGERDAKSGEYEVELGFGPAGAAKVQVDVTDTARFVPEFGSAAGPRGAISLSIWKDHLITIDYGRWRVKVAPGALPDPNDEDIFALEPTSRELRVALVIGSERLWCRVDPLFPRGLLLPASYAARLPLLGDVLDVGSVNVREKPVAVREARLGANVMLGPFEFDAPIVLFGEAGDTAIVGSQWLTGFSITYDFANARARLARRRAH